MSRYIDADWIIQKLERWRGQLAETYGENDEYVLCLGEVLMKLDDAPIADVRENVRGEWVQHTIGGNVWSIDKDTCSVCKETFYQISETGCVWNFCPNCGAQMVENDE